MYMSTVGMVTRREHKPLLFVINKVSQFVIVFLQLGHVTRDNFFLIFVKQIVLRQLSSV